MKKPTDPDLNPKPSNRPKSCKELLLIREGYVDAYESLRAIQPHIEHLPLSYRVHLYRDFAQLIAFISGLNASCENH